MTEHDPGRDPSHVRPDTAASPTVSRAGDHIHLVHAGSRPPEWLTGLAGRLAPARPSEAVVVVGTPLHEDGAEGLCELLAPALDASRDAHVRLLLLVMSTGADETGGGPSAAGLICERWGLDVLATAGTALVTSDGDLFSPDLPGASGGWWHFSPGADARRVSSHLPIPDWERAVKQVGRQTVAGHVVEPVPAGLAVRPAGPAPVTAHTQPHAVPPERDRPQLILASSHLPAAALAVVMAALPEHVRAALRLLSLDGRPLLRIGQALADLLDSEVRVAVGAPVATDGGIPDGASAGDATVEPRMVDSVGRPSWRPFARTVVCSPDRPPRVTEWQVPAALRGTTAPDELSLGKDCKAVVTPAGLWIGPRDGEPPLLAAARPLTPEAVAVDLGAPHQALPDGLWPGLDTLFGQLEPDVRHHAVVHVHGDLGMRDRERLLELSVRHGFGTTAPDGAGSGSDRSGLLAWLGTS
ncbi:hypothetical protein [Streptomyces sp. NBC_00019]|uniref:hypothetical protein n=1 Tax=Streptomyces sp. NBC_00019 TaxID=2975623 RepID=UPI002F915B60